MATSVTAGVLQITVAVDNPLRDDFGGLYIWMSPTPGFTPDPTNLVYNGLDLLVPLTKLTAGTPLVAGTTYYVRAALYTVIDPFTSTAYTISAEFSATPTAPTVVADDVTAGTIRGSNVFAGSFAIKGSTLTSALAGGEATLNLKSTADFASGPATAVIVSNLNDLDVINYTGKTATTLTGVTGVLAHNSGDLIIPGFTKNVVVDKNSNEIKVFTAGSNTPAATLGTNAGVGDYVAVFGYVGLLVAALKAYSSALNTMTVVNDNASALASALQGQAQGGGGSGVVGSSTGTGHGGKFSASDGAAVHLTGDQGPHIRAVPNAAGLPSSGNTDGDVAMIATGRMYVYDGSAWRELLKVEPSVFANVGTGGTVALATTSRRYVNTGAAKAALTFNLPASPVNGQLQRIATDNAITALAVRDSAGVAGNVMNAPATLAAGASCEFEYRTATTTWYRCG